MKKTLCIILSILMLSISTFAAADTNLNPTKYLLKGQTAPFDGFLVEKERIEKSIKAVQELEYQKRLNEINEKYADERLQNEKLRADLELKKQQLESAAVEKGLKQELTKKSAWYRQPWFVAGATAALFILSGGSIF